MVTEPEKYHVFSDVLFWKDRPCSYPDKMIGSCWIPWPNGCLEVVSWANCPGLPWKKRGKLIPTETPSPPTANAQHLQKNGEVKSDAFKFGDYVDEELSFLWSEVTWGWGCFLFFFGWMMGFLVVIFFGTNRWRDFVVSNVWFIAASSGSVQVWWKNYTNNFNRSPEPHRTS